VAGLVGWDTRDASCILHWRDRELLGTEGGYGGQMGEGLGRGRHRRKGGNLVRTENFRMVRLNYFDHFRPPQTSVDILENVCVVAG
jgi:hypothetical protein